MSEKLLKILLSELATARVLCKNCNRGIVEVMADRFTVETQAGRWLVGLSMCRQRNIKKTSADSCCFIVPHCGILTLSPISYEQGVYRVCRRITRQKSWPVDGIAAGKAGPLGETDLALSL